MKLQTLWMICLAAVLTTAQPTSAAELEPLEVHALVKLAELGFKVVVPTRSDVPWRATVSVGGPNATDANMIHLYFVPNLERLYLCGNRLPETEPPVPSHNASGDPRGYGLEGFGPCPYCGACAITDAGLAHLSALTKLKMLDTGGARLTEAGLAHLKRVTSLEELDLNGNATTGASLRHLKGLVNLKHLRVQGAGGSGAITDADLKHLENLTNIETLLIVNAVAITDAALEHLGKLTKLRELILIRSQINGEGLKHLRQLTNLQTLTLSGARSFGGEGLKHLEPLANLETLDLGSTPVTDLALVELSALSRLKSLDLDSTGVTDAGLEHLQRLTNLEELDLRSTQVTAGGLARHLSEMRNLKYLHVRLRGTNRVDIHNLKQALPGTKIHLYH